MLQLGVKWNWRPFIRSWLLCNASVGQVVCACGCSVANSNEQPGRRAPRSIDRTLSHRRRMEIGPGGVAKEVHTCLHLLWTHMDAGISTHVHTERTRRVCVRVCVCAPVFIDSRGCSLLTGPRMIFLFCDSMEHIEEGDLLGGPFSLFAAENSWISSTSPHVLSWCSLQLEASPKYTVH